MTQEPPKLTGHHKDTLRQIFTHPLSHNIEWRAVLSLLREVGSVDERSGHVEIKVGTETFTVDQPHQKDLNADDVLAVRHLLESIGFSADQ